jgi:hypothetical protein
MGEKPKKTHIALTNNTTAMILIPPTQMELAAMRHLDNLKQNNPSQIGIRALITNWPRLNDAEALTLLKLWNKNAGGDYKTLLR